MEEKTVEKPKRVRAKKTVKKVAKRTRKPKKVDRLAKVKAFLQTPVTRLELGVGAAVLLVLSLV